MTDIPHSIAVLGLGLMGGSLARALRACRPDAHLVAWTPDGLEPDRAMRSGVIDVAAPEAAGAVRSAELVVLAAPVGASIALLDAIARHLPPDALVTDVCSVKMPLLLAAEEAGLAERFAGSHPLCGSHREGWDSARADLYHGARVYVVPSADNATTRSIEAVWTAIGARPERIDAQQHDADMAWISHAPQVLASALGASLAAAGIPAERLGPGGRDMTRLSASSPVLWSDLLTQNRTHVVDVLTAVNARITAIMHAIESDDRVALEALLRAAREWAEET